MKTYSLSATGIIDYVYDVKTSLERQYGSRAAEVEVDPLVFYINTGRASCEFLRRLLETKPFLVARRLHKGGSIVEAMQRVFCLIGYTPEKI